MWVGIGRLIEGVNFNSARVGGFWVGMETLGSAMVMRGGKRGWVEWSCKEGKGAGWNSGRDGVLGFNELDFLLGFVGFRSWVWDFRALGFRLVRGFGVGFWGMG